MPKGHRLQDLRYFQANCCDYFERKCRVSNTAQVAKCDIKHFPVLPRDIYATKTLTREGVRKGNSRDETPERPLESGYKGVVLRKLWSNLRPHQRAGGARRVRSVCLPAHLGRSIQRSPRNRNHKADKETIQNDTENRTER